jgi:hypothetical protein
VVVRIGTVAGSAAGIDRAIEVAGRTASSAVGGRTPLAEAATRIATIGSRAAIAG